MTFGEALEALNNGAFVAREGWNGKGMFIYKVEASEATYDKLRGRCKDANAHSDMKAVDDSIILVGWLASQTDMKADDWHIVKEAD